MTIFVLGGAGFIGRRVVGQLAAQGAEVVSLDIAPAVFEGQGTQVRSVRADISDFETLVSLMTTHRPEAVLNLSYMRETTPRAALRVNVIGMDNCFEAARLAGVARVVYSSSIAVNGRQAVYGDRDITEDDAPAPITQYAHHKVFNEFQAREYREKHGMCITGVRAAHVTGADKTIGSVDHVRCITGPARGEPVRFEHRDRKRCVIHVDDMAQIFATLTLARTPKHPLYNSGGATLSLGEIADLTRRHIPDAQIDFDHQTGGAERTTAYRFDASRLRDEFGVTLPAFEERLEQMIAEIRGRATGAASASRSKTRKETSHG